MRRMNSAEQRYAEAFACAERGKSLEVTEGDLLQAAEQFQDAIRILSRLAIVESAAKRQLVQDAIDGLRERVDKIEASSEYVLARAMREHEVARRIEQEIDVDNDGDGVNAVIEAYLSAGDWYMKAYSALPTDESGPKAAVKEQIEYVIEHVSELKERQVAVKIVNAAVALLPPLPPRENEHHQQQQQQQCTHEHEQYASPPAILARGSASSSSDAFMQSRMSFSSLDWLEPPPDDFDDALYSEMEILSITPAAPTQLSPIIEKSGSAYTPQELDVLRRSSLINGHIFVPWLDDLDSLEQFDMPTLFEDPDGEVPLSAKQIRKDVQWMRPSEFAQVCGQAPVMIANLSPQAVKQDIVTDCSFVASLCIAAAYEQRFRKPLITNIIYPVDRDTKLPVYNPSGKYVVKLWANGVPRKVVIDDLLPASGTTGQLLSSCTTRENELWVSLIEKAYLKLNGGYDFPGGNSGIDLFALTGWIPERIAITDLLSDSRKEDRLWEQLKSAFHFGDCIITMSTGDIERNEAKRIGLVPMHVYAVLNVYEIVKPADEHSESGERKQRLLQLKNPWRKMSWKGPFSNFDEALWQSAVGDELRTYQKQFYPSSNNINSNGSNGNDSSSRSLDGSDDDDGLFWIDLDSVKKYFESIYLNWNPALFPHRDVCHEHWPVELGPANDAITLGFNPQYSLTFETTGHHSVTSATVWVLLTRHVRVVERDVDHASQQFLTLHVYHEESGKRVFYSQNALWRGAYSNNPHTLVSLDVDLTADRVPSFTLVASQYEKFAPLDYTISVFSTSQFTFQAVPQIINDPSSSVVVHGEWDAHTAGGRPFFSSFMNNPQYHVQLTGATAHLRSLYVFLEEASLMSEDAASTSAPVNLRAALHTHERVCGISGSSSSQLRVLSSGEYRPGFCLIEIPAEQLVGLRDFVVIPSTFEPGFLSKFTLRVVSDPPNAAATGIACHAVPPEGFGMALIQIRGRWDLQTGSAAGCSNYGCYTFNPKYLVRVFRECELFVRLQVTRDANSHASSHPPAINVSVFESTAEGDLMLSSNPKTAFRGASSEDGVYAAGNPSGVTTKKIGTRFPAGWYVLLPSTFEPHESAFELKIFASQQVELLAFSVCDDTHDTMATATATSESSWSHAPAATVTTDAKETPIQTSVRMKKSETEHDLELRLLRAFGTFVSDSLVGSYLYVKRSTRLTTLIGNTTEALVTKTGLIKLVEVLFAQFQRVAHPWLKVADEAMGRRIIDVFVSILLLAKVHEEKGGEQREHATTSDLEAGKERHLQPAVRLSYHERIQALLQGELPRVEALLQEAKRRELEALAIQQQLQLQQQSEQAARVLEPPPVVMELKDFVPVDEVKRIKETNKEQLQEKNHEVAALRDQLNALERERQKLEQDLTDVHSYQESERGRRFQEMEEELARTKLEANQKAHNLKKLELVVEALRRKRKSKSAKSEAGKSNATESD